MFPAGTYMYTHGAYKFNYIYSAIIYIYIHTVYYCNTAGVIFRVNPQSHNLCTRNH